MFKKKKIKIRKNRLNNKIIFYAGMIGVMVIFLLSIFIFNKINFDSFGGIEKVEIQTPEEIKEEKERLEAEKIKKELKLKKEKELKLKKILDDKKTNILIIGRGGYGNDAPELTDSLILLSYYGDKKHISMLSVPRDLYVYYGDKDKNGKKISGKINGLYVHYLEKLQDTEKSIIKLEDKIEEITNEEIDFYINIDFNGFIKLIDSIGGVKVTVPKKLVDENYPDNNHGFQTFVLNKGTWNLKGDVALKYVRSRKNTGGDFGRSERQQQVIKQLKEKILSSEYITSPSKIKELYTIFNKYIETDIGVLDFIKIATNIKLQNDLSFYSSGLNTTCIITEECEKGGFLFYPQRKYFGNQSVLLSGESTYLNLSDYDDLNKYGDLVFNSPTIFEENFKISIFSNKEDSEDAVYLKKELKKYGLKINIGEIIGNIPNPKIKLEEELEKKLEKKEKMTLEEYNNSIKSVNNKNIDNKIKNLISEEYNNKKTKLIINGVNINSNTIKFLKKYLNIENEDILEVYGYPKYAKDSNTQIEIIYKK